MAVKAGDFLLVNFTLKVKESGETVDTTYDAVAKDTHLHREDSIYGPRFIILGEGWLPKGLEDSLVGADVGKQTTVELPPDKGFGTRDPAKMRLDRKSTRLNSSHSSISYAVFCLKKKKKNKKK